MDRCFSTSWGLLCFESMKRSSFLDIKFSCFFVISFLGVVLNDEVSTTILLETSHEDVWHCLLNVTVVIKCAYPWRQLYFCEQALPKFPRMNNWVSSRVRSNQFHRLWLLSIFFSTQLLLLGVMILSFRDSWCSYHQDLKTNCSSFQLLFQKVWCLAEFQFELILWIVGFQLLEDFFVLTQWKCLLSWIPSFRVSLRLVS